MNLCGAGKVAVPLKPFGPELALADICPSRPAAQSAEEMKIKRQRMALLTESLSQK
jgi:hypothetical protein